VKGIIVFFLFFALSICWFILGSSPDNNEAVDQVAETNLVSGVAVDDSSLLLSSNQALNARYNDFKTLLSQKNWIDALDIYRNDFDLYIQMESIDVKNHPLKAQLLNTMVFLSASSEHNELSALINYTLSLYPNDSDFIQVKMNLLIGQGEVSNALDLYFTQLALLENEADKLLFISQFEKWLGNQFNIWQANESYQSIELVWKKLVRFSPENVKWHIQLTKALIWQGKFKEALTLIKPFQFDWDHQSEIDELLETINENYEKDNIKLVRSGHHFIVEGVFLDDKISPSQVSVDLLIDTGASFTVVDQKVFEESFTFLRVEFVRLVSANTANGAVEASMYKVAEFSVGGYVIEGFEIVVMDLAQNGSDTKGLLGMNFLQNFKFNIDQVNSVLYLSK